MLQLNRSSASRTKNIYLGVESDQGDGKITRINGNAGFAPSQ